jgi:hypothetical protein
MSKLNRRDYLRQMGAASAIVSVSKLLSPSPSSAKAKEIQKRVPQTTVRPAFLFTPKTSTPPSPTNLTVLFGGIMGFSNTNRGVAQVGFQKGTGKHKLEINLYQTISGVCYKYPSIATNGVKTMELAIPFEPDNVNFFHKDDFDRETGNARDFGWVLDFEDSLLHPGGVAITKKFSPVLTLRQGTFYTHQLTNSKFDLVNVDDHNKPLASLNQVPRLVGAAIEIPAGKRAVLRVDGVVEAELPQIAGVRYELQFMNECYDGGSHCKWLDPMHQSEKVRNDFYMHYFMFRPKTAARKCGVMMRDQVTGAPLQTCPPDKMAATDEAPCMAAGFGRQTGFQPGP